MTELLPCPFCGEVPPADCYHADENQGTKWGSVICGCGIRGPEVRTGYDLGPDASWHETAAQEWNTRATAAPVVVGEDAAREVIEAAQPFLADPNPQLGGGYLMNILVQASATRRLKAAIKSLTAALAGE